jgi:hypothetical protein
MRRFCKLYVIFTTEYKINAMKISKVTCNIMHFLFSQIIIIENLLQGDTLG